MIISLIFIVIWLILFGIADGEYKKLVCLIMASTSFTSFICSVIVNKIEDMTKEGKK